MKAIVVAVFCGILAFCASGADLALATRGEKATYSIIVPEKASEATRYAAEELQRFTERMTSVKLPIVTAAEPLPEKAVVLTEARDLGKLGEDGFILRTDGARVLVIGSAQRGVLWGVYELLERFGGCRWYSSWCEKIPERTALTVPADLNREEVPSFAMREPFWHDVIENHDFAARLRVNSHSWARTAAKYGGESFRFGGGLGSCHTFLWLVPPDKYFDAHPEYFSELNGKRVKNNSQLCLTNPDVLKLVTSNVLARIRKDPTARFYGVSQNDWGNYCTCTNCAAVDKEEGSPSGTIVRFVNAIAAEVEKEFPEAIIETLAYQYSRKPPAKTRLRHNVTVCLCSIECDFASSMTESRFPSNQSYLKDIEGWSKMTDKLYVWDYVTNFSHFPLPFPNVYTLQGNLRFFRDNGVKYMFEQGAQKGYHGEFAELKAWLLAKLMWNCELSVKDLLDDFFAGYYGKGAPFVREYFEELHALQRAHSADGKHPLGIYDNVFNAALSDEFLARADKLFEQAEAATKDDEVSNYNVKRSAFSVRYARLERMRGKLVPDVVLVRGKYDLSGLNEAKRIAAKILPMVEGADAAETKIGRRKIALAENGGENAKRLKAWRELGKLELPEFIEGSATAVVQDDKLEFGEKKAVRVDDPLATDGKAIKLFNTHYEWTVLFKMHHAAFEPGAKYKLRARVRVDKAMDGNAFWAGIYDYRQNRYPGTLYRKTQETPNEYRWYDIATWVPQNHEYFWFGPGMFDKAKGKSAVNAVYLDCIEFSRID